LGHRFGQQEKEQDNGVEKLHRILKAVLKRDLQRGSIPKNIFKINPHKIDDFGGVVRFHTSKLPVIFK
jgi:hypothetical protein